MEWCELTKRKGHSSCLFPHFQSYPRSVVSLLSAQWQDSGQLGKHPFLPPLSFHLSYSTSSLPSTMRRYNRSASTLITLFGAITNAVLTIQVLSAWRSIKWEPESEWELSEQKWQLTSVKIIWGLLSIYFASAASVCAVGFHGVVKVRHSVTLPKLVNQQQHHSINYPMCDSTATIPSQTFLSAPS